MIIGAIIGDMCGSVWEFHPNMKKMPPKVMMDDAYYTDDTVMTVAVADALLHDKDLAQTMREWGMRHRYFKCGGYGARFIRWLFDPSMGAYYSCGNGSAMRVSAAGWLCDTLEDTLALAEKTAVVSHNHPEGIKGAKVTAGAIFLARTGHSKDDIRKFACGLGYDLSRTCDEIRPGYYHIETCQESIPEALTAFLESTSFEDCMNLCISLGGDADTLCAIAGAIAEAFYGAPKDLVERAKALLDDDLLAIVNECENSPE